MSSFIEIHLELNDRGAPDLDPDLARYKHMRIQQNMDPAGSKQSGLGQPDSLPITVRMHCVLSPNVRKV